LRFKQITWPLEVIVPMLCSAKTCLLAIQIFLVDPTREDGEIIDAWHIGLTQPVALVNTSQAGETEVMPDIPGYTIIEQVGKGAEGLVYSAVKAQKNCSEGNHEQFVEDYLHQN